MDTQTRCVQRAAGAGVCNSRTSGQIHPLTSIRALGKTLIMLSRSQVSSSLRLAGAAFGYLLATQLSAQVPAFTDANWTSLGTAPGADGPVWAAVSDGAGNV